MRSRSDVNWNTEYREADPSIIKREPAAGSRATLMSNADSIIASECVIKGDLELHGRAHINGKVEGEITSDGELIVGEQGTIRANISGKSVIILGRVEGHIKCSERLEMHAGAHVTGDVLSPRVVIQDGVLFDGRCWMAEDRKTQS